MKTLAQKLRFLFPDANFDPADGDILVTFKKDANGIHQERIERWDRAEAEPTAGELNAVTDQDVDDAVTAHDTDFEGRFDPLLKAFALVVLEEINTLRTQAGLQPRTVAQFKQAIRGRYNA